MSRLTAKQQKNGSLLYKSKETLTLSVLWRRLKDSIKTVKRGLFQN
jgi:hypothetical protein